MISEERCLIFQALLPLRPISPSMRICNRTFILKRELQRIHVNPDGWEGLLGPGSFLQGAVEGAPKGAFQPPRKTPSNTGL